MREVKFRGKRIDTGEWVYGYYIKEPNNVYVIRTYQESFTNAEYKETCILELDYEIAPKTIGQYTGFKDKSGQEIYEGNIVKAWYEENNGLDYKEYNDVGKIVWGNGCWIIKMTSRDFAMALCDYDTELDVEVIGDIHEDKNSLEVEQ